MFHNLLIQNNKAIGGDINNILDFINNKEIVRELKIEKLNELLNSKLPELKGDIVTFIGSTFINYGCKDIYKNHCLVLNDCSKIELTVFSINFF